MIFTVPDISCGHCKAAIEAEISAAGGTAEVDIAAKTVVVTGLDAETARAAIKAAGHQVAAG